MRSIIISGGKAPSYELIKQELDNSSYLICADSGANCLYNYHIRPDIILGDLDSINEEVLNHFEEKNVIIEKFPREKDFTDTEAALNKAIELESEEIVFLGNIGTRMDHFLGNLGLLLRCLKLGIKAVIKDEHNSIMMVNESVKVEGNIGDIFSLISYHGNVENLSIYGAKYPLKNYTLEIGSPLGVSNEFIEKEITIIFNKGILIVILARD